AKWALDSQETFALLSGVLAVIHPSQFHQGVACMRALEHESAHPELITDWACVFNALSILVNREAIFHRDGGGYYEWYDLLASIGRYCGGQLSFPGLGIDLDYRPGSVVPFCGNALRHGAPPSMGDRVCLAFYMRKSVHVHTQTNVADWSYTSVS
ncbi:hypothetical protein CONPUDRAFT_57153, partial [Coniophora puteana RWD-64-598 SS2]